MHRATGGQLPLPSHRRFVIVVVIVIAVTTVIFL